MINPCDIKVGDEFHFINSTMSGEWFEKYINCKVMDIKITQMFSPNERGGISKDGNNFRIIFSFEDFEGCFHRTGNSHNREVYINDFEELVWDFCNSNELYSWEDYENDKY